jgi:tetratricopeptide (TPR) repeat protein
MYTALGQAQREAGQFEVALATLQTALELDSAQAEALYAIGYCFLATKRRPEAKPALAKALEIRPDYPEALKLRAAMAIEEGDVVAAEDPVKRLMALRGGEEDVRLLYAALHLIKGNMARNTGQSDHALRLYGAGLDILPDFLPLLREAGRLSRRLGREEQARQFFRRGAAAAEAQGDAAQATDFRQLLTQS